MSQHDQRILIEDSTCHVLFMDNPTNARGINELRNLIYDQNAVLGMDTETTGLRPGKDDIRLFQIGTKDKVWVFPFAVWRETIREWLWTRRCTLLTQNGIFDYLHLSVEFGELVPLHDIQDTMILAHHWDGRAVKDGGLGVSLAALIREWISPELAQDVKGSLAAFAKAENEARKTRYDTAIDALKEQWNAAKASMGKHAIKWKDVDKPERPKRVTIGDVYREIELTNPTYLLYAGVDILVLERIFTKLWNALSATGVHDLDLYRQDMEDFRNVIRMGYRDGKGIEVVEPYFRSLGERWDAEREAFEAELLSYGITKSNSTKQVTEALLAEGHKLTDKTNGGNLQVNERVLLKCEANGSEVARNIIEAKRRAKWKTTYVDGILEATHEGRLYPQLNPLGAASGRYSSSDPNMQNIPSKTNEVRNGFKLDWSIDYSALELRGAALCSGDSQLRYELANGINPMKALTARIFGEGYNKSQYAATKTIVYATLYEGGATTVSIQSGQPYDLVTTVQDAWYDTYHEYKAWTKRQTELATTRDYVIGYDGRVMVVPRGRNRQGRIVPKPYTAASRIVQGLGATIMKAAIRAIQRTEYMGLVALSVHDELDGVNPWDGNVGRMFDVLIPCMEGTIDGVHFPVEAEWFADGLWQGHYTEDRVLTERTTPEGRKYTVSAPM